jgi:hypothetical protein
LLPPTTGSALVALPQISCHQFQRRVLPAQTARTESVPAPGIFATVQLTPGRELEVAFQSEAGISRKALSANNFLLFTLCNVVPGSAIEIEIQSDASINSNKTRARALGSPKSNLDRDIFFLLALTIATTGGASIKPKKTKLIFDPSPFFYFFLRLSLP